MLIRRFIPEQAKPKLRKINNYLKRYLSPCLPLKPFLDYVELHLTDHCNLNCKGCGHFGPIADKWFAKHEEYASDMLQLSKLFSSIGEIRLMGGEPLLHPQVTAFLSSTRSCFPRSNIHLVTNGILIPKMPSIFWETCKTHSVTIDLTVYPGTDQHVARWLEIAHQRGVILKHRGVVEWFHAHTNLRGDSDPDKAFRICRARYHCPFLRHGKLYICAMPALVHYFNRRYRMNIPSSGYVDIYQRGITGFDVLDVLEKPAPTCCYCSYDFPRYRWEVSNQNMEDWDASTFRVLR